MSSPKTDSAAFSVLDDPCLYLPHNGRFLPQRRLRRPSMIQRKQAIQTEMSEAVEAVKAAVSDVNRVA